MSEAAQNHPAQDMRRQQVFLDALITTLRQDRRVLAAWLEGSLARPVAADRYSDVDLHVLVKADLEQGFRDRLSDLLDQIQPVLYYRPLPSGSMMAMVLFENLLQLDIWVEAGENKIR